MTLCSNPVETVYPVKSSQLHLAFDASAEVAKYGDERTDAQFLSQGIT